MPFGSTGSFTDEEWANGVRADTAWETFVARDLVRAVDARYRTIRSGSARALAGLSEGGYGALNIGSTIPASSASSRAGRATSAPTSASIFGHRRAMLARNSPRTIAAAAADFAAAHTFIWFYSGSDDHFRRQNAASPRS